MIEDTKKCGKCQEVKSFTEFNKCQSGRFGLHNHCRECQRKCKANWYQLNRESELAKKKTPEHKEKARNRAKEKYWSDEDWRKEQLLKNRERRRLEPAKIKQRANEKFRRENDLNYKMRTRLNSRLKGLLKNIKGEKTCSILELLDCSLPDFIKHLESQWDSKMNWNNYGPGIHNWHIEHILPCRSFDLTKEEEQKKCFHYTNLRPLWGLENLQKGSKLPDGTDAKKISFTENLL